MLRGERVDLRPIAESDLAQLESWRADPDYAGEYNAFGLWPAGSLRRAFAQDGLLADDAGRLLVVDKAGKPVGDVSYRLVKHGGGLANRAYDIGLTIAPDQRGRGYGAEAQRLLAAYLFATYPIARVQAGTDVTNVAEQRALERAGFTREGVLRQAQFRLGGWHDMVVYSKLRGE
ncbi:MAG TPA: GNAT family protein [Thermomicrobiaceae bacterium]|nr:GNAT family protein [Thermomicrobiaceae bacterium]